MRSGGCKFRQRCSEFPLVNMLTDTMRYTADKLLAALYSAMMVLLRRALRCQDVGRSRRPIRWGTSDLDPCRGTMPQ